MIRLALALLVASTICMGAFMLAEAATIPGDRQRRASWGGPSDDPSLARGYWDSPVQLGVFVDSSVIDGLDPLG